MAFKKIIVSNLGGLQAVVVVVALALYLGAEPKSGHQDLGANLDFQRALDGGEDRGMTGHDSAIVGHEAPNPCGSCSRSWRSIQAIASVTKADDGLKACCREAIVIPQFDVAPKT